MFNKELLMGSTGGQQPVALTVASFRVSSSQLYYGYGLGYFGRLEPRPFWGNAYLNELRYDNRNNRTMCSMTDRITDVTVYISGYQDSPIRGGEAIFGDPFRFTAKCGQTVYLTFDPPPTGTRIHRHTNRSKKRVLCRRSSLGGSRC